MLLKDVSLAVQHLLHHIGLIEVAAVDTGRLGPDQLQGSDIECLTEGIGRKGDQIGVEILLTRKNPLNFADHINVCLLHQAKSLEILIKRAGTQRLANLDKGRIAGVSHRLFQNLMPVSAAAGAVKRLIPAFDHYGTGTVKGGVHVDNTLLQRRR